MADVGASVGNRAFSAATRPSTNVPCGTDVARHRTVSPETLTTPLRGPWPQARIRPGPGGTVNATFTVPIVGCASPTHFQYSSTTSGPTTAAPRTV